jgi:monofunctional biosynthetic peptidoglycan transglycosylase
MKKTRTSSRRWGGWRKRFRRAALVLLLGLVLGAALPVAALRFVPPLGSALMLERWVEARAAGRSFRLRYDWVPTRRISPALRRAVVASEDQRFFEHRGFDWRSMQSAVGAWWDGERLRGASTISQQVAKNLFLWPGRSFLRKGLEAWLTLWIEVLWPKQRILEVYLNVVELGDGVFGAEAAARRYFGRSAAGLAAHEAALLAAMLPSPRRASVANPSRALRERQLWILRQI